MADNNTILEKLEGLVARFEEVSTLITDPAVIADQKRYVKLTKEYKELGDLMNARKEYMQVLGRHRRSQRNYRQRNRPGDAGNGTRRAGCLPSPPTGTGRADKAAARPPPTRRMAVMPSSKFVAARVVTKRQSLPATSSACTPSIANPRDGEWRYPAPTKVQPAVSRKLSAP